MLQIGDTTNFVQFHFESNDPTAMEVYFSINATSNGFCGRFETVGFFVSDLSDFVDQLETIERERKGEAKLTDMGGLSEYSHFRLKIFFTDRLGHPAISIDMAKPKYIGNNSVMIPNRLSVTFELSAEMLFTIVTDVKAFFRS